jgi:hypothetical protein
VALSDTARLIASLELQDKFSGTATRFGGTLSKLEQQTGTLGKIGGQIGSGLQSTAQNLTRIGVAGAGLLAVAVTNGVHQLELLENAQAQTNAVLTSTQGISGQTAESVRNLAEKYEGLNATIDDKVIQSTENMLLSFTNVRKDAFEPALQAILDLNEGMGGGEEGLQAIAIKVGKALNDPIKGLTALGKAGVLFTADQKARIKQLVAENDLYGAQRIILDEISVEFGGRFAAAGGTATGKFAKLKDAIEDAQRSLATAFLPVLVKVSDKLGTFLTDPAVIARIESFGDELAGGFDKLLAVGGSLPWQQIGDAFKIVGTGSKALLDAFLGLPPWVQTAVLTGWGLNKLTGGALGGIAGTLTKALVTGTFGARGATPANPLFVSQVGGIPGAGGAPVAAAGGGASLLTKVFLTGIATEAGFLLGSAISNALVDAGVGGIKPAKTFEQGALTATIDSKDVERIVSGIDSIDENLAPSLLDLGLSLEDSGAAIANALDIGGVRSQLEKDRQVLIEQLTAQGLTLDQARRMVDEIRAAKDKYGTESVKQIAAVERLHLPLGLGNVIADQIRDKGAEAVAKQQAITDAIRAAQVSHTTQTAQQIASVERLHLPLGLGNVLSGQIRDATRAAQSDLALTALHTATAARLTETTLGPLNRIAAKEFSATVNLSVATTTFISASNVVRTLNSYTAAIGSGPGGALDASLL